MSRAAYVKVSPFYDGTFFHGHVGRYTKIMTGAGRTPAQAVLAGWDRLTEWELEQIRMREAGVRPYRGYRKQASGKMVWGQGFTGAKGRGCSHLHKTWRAAALCIARAER